jgi:short-subunit dehydrogenase
MEVGYAIEREKAVVIGGSSGIGLAVAKALVGSGAHVVIASRSSDKLEEAQRTIGANTGQHRLARGHQHPRI